METKLVKTGNNFPMLVYPEKCTGCRTCQVMCSVRNTDEFNPLKSYITITRDHGKRTTAIEFTGDCTGCGYCARFCPYGALVLKKSIKSNQGGS
jgi:anaerobic carbon-monoxide dehydrogenase iron sulfur subunit